jgi:RHS repeat-associated protein
MRAKRGRLFLTFVGMILGAAVVEAQTPNCVVSVSAGQPDASGIVAYHVDAHSNTPSCNPDELDRVSVWLDSTNNVLPGGGECNFVQQCSYDRTLDTYCWAPLTPHHLISGCSAYCTGSDPPPVDPAATFSIGVPTAPGLSISYDPLHGLTRTWSFVPGHAGSNSIYIDNALYSSGPVPGGTDSGTTTGQPVLSPCGGDHTLTVYANTCGAPDGYAYWSTRRDVAVKDPGDPTVSIHFEPANGSYIGKVTYGFPSVGSRTVRIVRKAKPPYTMSDTEIMNFQPADLTNTVTFTPDSTSGEQTYEATATSGNCSPPHEAKDDAKLDNNCCPLQSPNGGFGGPPPIGSLGGVGSVGGPVRLTTGNMHYTDSEPLPQALVSLTRTYDSSNTTVGAFGLGWTSLFDAGAVLIGTGNDQSVVISTEENKRYVWFIRNGVFLQTWPKNDATPAILGGNGTGGFTLRESGADLTRTFNSSGRLVGLTSARQQRTLSVAYDGNGRPTQVTDSWGNVTLLVTTDPTSGLITRIDVSGRPDIFWTYQYSSNQLVAVVAPDSHQWRQYQYTSGLLSTILDPLGNVIESHSYDAYGRATSSIQSANDITSIQYGLAGRNSAETLTTVTYASGKVSNYYSRPTGGSVLTVDVFGGCAACSSENGTYVYDLAGHAVRSQDARGYITDAVYAGGILSSVRGPLKPSACDPQTDANHCRMTVEDLTAAAVVTTPVTLTTNYVYGDANWPDRPTSITIDSVANPAGTRLGTLTYDATTGQVLSRTETGWISPTQPETHTTTTTLYSGSEGAAFDPGGPFQSSWLTLPQPVGLRKQVDGPRTDVSDLTTFVYYPIDPSVTTTWRGKLAAIRDALGHITTYSNYDVFGNAQTVVDPNAVVMNTTYDALGRLLTSKYPAISGCDTTADPTCNIDIVSSRSYSPGAGPLATEIKPRGGVTSYTYDSRGRVASITRTVSSTLSERIEYDYDPNTGQKSAERFLDNSSGSFVTKKSVSYSYDAEGRLAQTTYPDAAKVVYTYDVAGALATSQDENHATANTSYTYDAKGAVSSVAQTLGAGQATTSYAYDAHGNLTSVTDPNGNVTSYSYDDFGRMTRQVSPVTGTTTYAYDFAGNLLTTIDANGATTTRTYDALLRVASATSARSGSPSENVTYSYDDPFVPGYDIGRFSAASDPTGTTTVRYDHRGLMRQLQQTVGGAQYSTLFTYDADGNRSSITYPSSGRVATYTYDLADRPLSVASSGTTFASSATYLPFGPLTGFTYGNGLKRAMSYDTRYRITENKLFNPPTNIARYSYSYDAAGNILGIQDVMDGTYSRTFAYDDLNRLTTANTGTSLWGAGSYAYDAMGNLTSRSLGTPPPPDPGGLSIPGRHVRSTTTVTGQVDRLSFTFVGTTPKISVVTANGLDHTVSYDNAGNETGYYVARTYSPRNVMNGVTDTSGEGPAHSINYGYDYRGVRVSRTESPTDAGSASRYYFYTPQLQLLASTVDDSYNVWGQSAHIMSTPLVMNREVIWFNGAPVGEFGPPRTPDTTTELSRHRTFDTNTPANNLFYTFTDHLGTPLIQTDPTTAIVWRAEHEPYGNVYLMRKGSRTDQPLRFPGQEAAMTWEGAEENYNIFRWYRGGWGRYTQADPLGLLLNVNLFGYVDARPGVSTDPLGLGVFSCCKYEYLCAKEAAACKDALKLKLEKLDVDEQYVLFEASKVSSESAYLTKKCFFANTNCQAMIKECPPLAVDPPVGQPYGQKGNPIDEPSWAKALGKFLKKLIGG